MTETTTFISSEQRSRAVRLKEVAKRLFDIVVSFLGLLLLMPVFAWLAWLVHRDTPGPVFYHGERVGRRGKVFKILKFRTMHEDASSYAGPRLTAAGDERITPVGKWLRDTKLNELPQLWNVLKGDMSLVGPRPEDPSFAKNWTKEYAMEILSVRPGITSPAAVLYRDEEKQLLTSDPLEKYLKDIQPSKQRLDQLYVRNRTFWADLDIILWTLLVFIPQVGQGPDEVRLLRGPFQVLMQRHIRWFMVDLATTFVSMAITAVAWRAQAPLDRGWPQMLLATLAFAILFSITNMLTGANRVSWSSAEASEVGDLIPGAVLATAIALGANNIIAAKANIEHFLPDGLLLMSAALSFMGYVITRYRSRLITGAVTRWLAARGSQTLTRERVLIVGGGETGEFAAWKLGHGYYANSFEIVGFIDDDLNKQGSRIRGLNVIGRTSDLVELVKTYDVGLVVFAIHNITRIERKRLLSLCESTSAQVFVWPDIAAAIYAMLAHERSGNLGKRTAGVAASNGASIEPRGERLPCELCLVKLSPMFIEDWLELLEQSVYRGDLDALQEQIRNLREIVYGEAALQREANQS
jgi:lipopolysaccharide/colanic/teichoic acid biosynthesis glycosyltransferase